jgi:hypothetical protein
MIGATLACNIVAYPAPLSTPTDGFGSWKRHLH